MDAQGDFGAATPADNLAADLERAIDEGIGFDTQGDQFDAETAPASPIAAETRRAPAEDPATLFTSKNTWYIRSAQAIALCIMGLTRRLEVNKSIAYFNEWCDTELNVTPGAAYKEAVVRHDQDERKTITHKKTRSLWDYLYFGIMRNLLDASDPAVEAAVQSHQGIPFPLVRPRSHSF